MEISNHVPTTAKILMSKAWPSIPFQISLCIRVSDLDPISNLAVSGAQPSPHQENAYELNLPLHLQMQLRRILSLSSYLKPRSLYGSGTKSKPL